MRRSVARSPSTNCRQSRACADAATKQRPSGTAKTALTPRLSQIAGAAPRPARLGFARSQFGRVQSGQFTFSTASSFAIFPTHSLSFVLAMVFS